MSVYVPNSRHLREVLIFCFNMKKSAAETHRMLVNTYGEAAISERTCREWFQRFKNGVFDVEDRHNGGREKIFEDAELEGSLDQDSCQTQEELAKSLGVTRQAISKRLKTLGMIQKQGNWVPYELKPRDVERRLFILLLFIIYLGKSYLTRRILQTLLLRTITCFDQWRMAWLTSTSGLSTK